MVKNVTQIKKGITVNIVVSGKIQVNMHAKRLYLESCPMYL